MIKSNLSVFSFVVCASGVILEKSLPDPRSWRFSPMFSSHSFIVLVICVSGISCPQILICGTPLASSPAGPPDGREPTFLYMVNSRHLTHVCGICVVRGLCPLPRLALPPTPDAQDHTHLLLTTARPGGSALLQGACPQSQLLRNGGHKLPRTRQAQRCLWGSSRDPTGEVPARSHLQASP